MYCSRLSLILILLSGITPSFITLRISTQHTNYLLTCPKLDKYLYQDLCDIYTIRCSLLSCTMHTILRQPPTNGEMRERRSESISKIFCFLFGGLRISPLNSLQTVAMRIQFSSELVWFMGNRQSKQGSPTPMKFGTQREDFILILFSDICLRALYKFTFTKNWFQKLNHKTH